MSLGANAIPWGGGASDALAAEVTTSSASVCAPLVFVLHARVQAIATHLLYLSVYCASCALPIRLGMFFCVVYVMLASELSRCCSFDLFSGNSLITWYD